MMVEKEKGKANVVHSIITQLSALASTAIHSDNRRKTIQSHLRHVKENFKTFSENEFDKFVLRRYVESTLKGKPFSVAYTTNVIKTICRHHQVSYDILRIPLVIRNIKKVSNPANLDKRYYGSKGTECLLDLRTEVSAVASRQFYTARLVVESKEATRILYYTPEQYNQMVRYFSMHLRNFLNSNRSGGTANQYDQLAMIVVFLACCPRRISEVLALTPFVWNQLIHTGCTVINNKSNVNTMVIHVPVKLQNILLRYATLSGVQMIPPSRTQRMFPYSYFTYLRVLRNIHKHLFGHSIERPFHAFRNYFAAQHIKGQEWLVARALGHTRKENRRYARKYTQEMQKHQRRLAAPPPARVHSANGHTLVAPVRPEDEIFINATFPDVLIDTIL